MMDISYMKNFSYIVSYLTPRIQNIINNIDKTILLNIQEIRIRAERPIVIIANNECYFINQSGKISSIYSPSSITVYKNEVTEIFNKMCDYSLHSHYEDVLNGYVTLKNGARVGITGTAVYDKTNLKGIRNVDGLNIRIPRNVKNCSSIIFNEFYKNSIDNLLIAGAPSSGKTTILKDLIYQLSVGKAGKYYKVCVIDERKEITSSNVNVDEIGYNTDILYGFSKPVGISMAVRCLSPHIIICDEISNDDAEIISNAMNSGVKFIFTIHAENLNELKHKKVYKKLSENECIKYVLFINSFNNFTIIKDDKIKEVSYEKSYYFNNNLSDNIPCN